MEILRKYWLILCIVGSIGVFWIFSNGFNNSRPEEQPKEQQILEMNSRIEEDKEDTGETEAVKWIVDIKGEVRKPGVYEADADNRVGDLIEMAGGFTEDADEDFVNLAVKIHDEMMIHVPKKGDEDKLITEWSKEESESPLRINLASEEELTALSGIGPSKAAAIITYREENGPFNEVKDLLNVTGIGEKTLEKIEEEILVP
ncbi:helix-hairpin-helix domain-containing protein [Sediminibacillus massiliensis]|uniref:helix-hairpin-helix domain-containing protein n=1 Tax=Sediminibacillus massiliensis TaxID=1926277 RepID=UPI001FE62C7A|nr:helix-hairpin-helix domain-containing protein [Sediminibacillus massiliensis]